MKSRDPHRYRRRVEREVAMIRKHPDITAEDKELILRFYNRIAGQGLGAGRTAQMLGHLKRICGQWAPHVTRDLSSATDDDIRAIVALLEGSQYAPHTKLGFRVTLRAFYSWLHGGARPDERLWLPAPKRQSTETLPQDLLTDDEVSRLISAGHNARDKALTFVLYESGCRIGELLDLQIKHVTFDENGAVLLVHGKTGSRRVRVVAATPYLMDWLAAHPHCEVPDAWVWCARNGQPICYSTTRTMLRRAARRAGVSKRVNPHNFRHSRATLLAQHLTESQMSEVLGWTRSSTMAAVYVHLSAADLDRALLRLHGIETDSSWPREAATEEENIGQVFPASPAKEVAGVTSGRSHTQMNVLKVNEQRG